MDQPEDVTFKAGDKLRIDLIVPMHVEVKADSTLKGLTAVVIQDMNVGRRQVSAPLYKFRQAPCRQADPPEVSIPELKELWMASDYRVVAKKLSEQHPCVLAQFILLGGMERWIDVAALTILTNLMVDVLTDANKERFQLKE